MKSSTTELNNSQFLKYSHTIGLCTMLGRGFMFPSDTAIASDGKLFTVSRGHPGDLRTRRVTSFDTDSQFYGVFGEHGEGYGQFIWPSAIAVDRDDNIYISDEYTNRINIFDKTGKSITHWGEPGDKIGHFRGPSGMAFDSDDNLYIADHGNHRIQKFTKDGEYLTHFSSKGSKDGQLELPWGLSLDKLNNVYVANWRNDRIEKFSPEGIFLRYFGSSGNGDGQFNRPSSVAIDMEGYMYIADWGNERVQILDCDGAFVTKLRGSATVSKWAKEFLETNVEEADARSVSDLEPDLTQFNGDPHEESAHTEKFFWGPSSVKLDENNSLYVTESNRHRIQIYERN